MARKVYVKALLVTFELQLGKVCYKHLIARCRRSLPASGCSARGIPVLSGSVGYH